MSEVVKKTLINIINNNINPDIYTSKLKENLCKYYFINMILNIGLKINNQSINILFV